MSERESWRVEIEAAFGRMRVKIVNLLRGEATGDVGGGILNGKPN